MKLSIVVVKDELICGLKVTLRALFIRMLLLQMRLQISLGVKQLVAYKASSFPLRRLRMHHLNVVGE